MKRPELLAPAGSMQHVRYAFAYGADAVYAGQPRYSLRVRNNEFSKIEALGEAIDYAHSLGKKLYVVSNIAPHNTKLKTYLKDMKPVIDLKPDALIMSDPGLIMMIRDEWPDMPIHLSVQANAVNYKTVEFWQRMGLERVILSRELSIEEIEEIRQYCPDMELEVFVHGALCIAYSGRCLLSGYMNRRDPNQGTCTNACRWKYQAHDAVETPEGDVVAVDPAIDACASGVSEQNQEPAPVEDIVLLQEANRPGEFMPAFEDEHGTYIMNSKDLRAVEHVDKLTRIGVHSLKIEGRTKSFFYVARTAQVYKRAIDLAMSGQDFDPSLLYELDSLANRGYTEGFYRRHKPQAMQSYDTGHSVSRQQQFVGEIINFDQDSPYLEINVKNRFEIGDELELMTPTGNTTFVLEALLDKQGVACEVAKGSGHFVRIPRDQLGLDDVDGEFSLVMKTLPAPMRT